MARPAEKLPAARMPPHQRNRTARPARPFLRECLSFLSLSLSLRFGLTFSCAELPLLWREREEAGRARAAGGVGISGREGITHDPHRVIEGRDFFPVPPFMYHHCDEQMSSDLSAVLFQPGSFQLKRKQADETRRHRLRSACPISGNGRLEIEIDRPRLGIRDSIQRETRAHFDEVDKGVESKAMTLIEWCGGL